MPNGTLDHLTEENRRLLDLRKAFDREVHLDPTIYWPFLRPCIVDVLVVIDGLEFSDANFGLSTFIRTLLDMPGRYVRFKITLAHIFDAAPAQMLAGEPRIANRITRFRFDNVSHFGTNMYDVVFLFGIATSFPGRGNDSNGNPSPVDRLSDTELRALTLHMNAKGGLFATGDHGVLGKPLSSAVPRARSMRLWSGTSGDVSVDEVSMDGPRRNDTNRIGHDAGSQFDDQSDDVPQDIQPRLYSRRTGLFRYSFPHPLLCSPNGMIRVMPDHPHEGQCVEPSDPNLTLNFGGALGKEYPDAISGSRPLPEIISTSTVLSGTRSGVKQPTVGQTFGGICAYDGHRVGVGRVVTDATWHHFVNINLVGDLGAPMGSAKRLGFLATAAGQAHFEAIKTYYRNLAVWLSPPERISCMNARLSWSIVWNDRVMEAVLTTAEIRVSEVRPGVLQLIGRHARDVLGRYVGACQTMKLILDLVMERALPDIIPHIDPWGPVEQRTELGELEWFDGNALLDVALGGALVALREVLPHPDPKSVEAIDSDTLRKAAATGGRQALDLALKDLVRTARTVKNEFRPAGGNRSAD
ncbi:MAG: hypothetical protein U1E46_07970 [Hyphomicrobiales bacterium]